MNKTLAAVLVSASLLVPAACSKEAPPAPAAKKDEAKPDAGRPMPPAAPTAAPAEGEKKVDEKKPGEKK